MKTLEETRREIAKKRQVQSSMKHVMMKHSGIVSGVVAFGLLVLAVLALDVEISFLHVVGEQKRAYVLLGTGLVCLLGSSVGTLIARSKARGMVLSLVFVLEVMALAVGLYFLTVLDYHERASTPLGIGTVCLLGGAVGEIVAQRREAFHIFRVPGTSRWCLSKVGQKVLLTLKGVRLRTILSPVLDPHMWQWPQTLVTKERSSSAGGA